MYFRLIETPEINRRGIRDNLPEVVGKLRHILRREGFDIGRRLALDLSQPGVLQFRYAGSILTPHTAVFRLKPRGPLTPEEKYSLNLRELKTKGKAGKYLR